MTIPTERHPLEPFLPQNCRLLMLGSFPPKRDRWSMNFFYPNFGNDMWRIWGHIFFGERSYFEVKGEKRFDSERIVKFCREQGIGLYDTACEVRRLKDNASDKFLEVVEATDIGAMIERLPHCRAIATTGERATETLVEQLGCATPRVGEAVEFSFRGRTMRLWRMPSSSRAYPLRLERKAEAYEQMLNREGIL